VKIKFLDNINQIKLSQFNKPNSDGYPFLKHEFLFALEKSKSVCSESGWQPKHLTIWDKDQLIGFMPLYIKTHSYGEYVFDFQWANAYHQSGLDYYPKLISAIPFTPCSGPRLIVSEELDRKTKNAIQKAIVEEVEKLGLSSFHLLFPETDLFENGSEPELLSRVGMQYHWYNDDYKNFGDFLSHCKMKSRKNIKRERKAIHQSNIQIETLEGRDITSELWKIFYSFYCATYAKRSGNYGYLNESFFQLIGETMPESLFMKVAKLGGKVIAISLFFKDSKTLYGRYWGCSQEIEFLHFELCYYQGIDYCIENNLEHFDAGAQGEHKISRGFKPIKTFSYHWIKDERFRDAIRNFLNQETPYISESIIQLSTKLPFK